MGLDSPCPKYRTPVFASPELVGWPQIYCTLPFWRKIVCMWSVARRLRTNLPLMLRPIYNIHSSSTSVQPPLPCSLAPTPLLQKRCIQLGPDGSVFPSPSLSLSLSLSRLSPELPLAGCVCLPSFSAWQRGCMLRITGGLAFHRRPLPLPFAWTTVATGARLCDFLLTELSGFVDTKETWITLCSDAFGARMPRPKLCTRRSPSPPWPCTAAPTTSPTPDLPGPSPPCSYVGEEGGFGGPHHRVHPAPQHPHLSQHQPSWHVPQMPSIDGERHGLCLPHPDPAAPEMCGVGGAGSQGLCAGNPTLSGSDPSGASCVSGEYGDRPCHLLSRSDGIAKGRVTVQVRSSKRFLPCSYAFSRKGIVNLILFFYLDFCLIIKV